MKKLIYFLLLMSLCSVSNNYKITNAKPIEEETVIASEFIEEVTVDGITVERNVLSEENYNWNLASERQMREEYPNRKLGDTFELSYDPEVKLSKHINGSGEKGIVPPPWAEPPTYVIEGFNISGNTYAGAVVTYGSENGGAQGYYRLNGGTYIAFNSGKYFALPGTYGLKIVDNFNLQTTGTLIIVDNMNINNPSMGPEIQLGDNTFSGTSSVQMNYSQHYLSVTTSRYSRYVSLHDRVILDVMPSERYNDLHMVIFQSDMLELINQGINSRDAFFFEQRLTYRIPTIAVEFDDYHWITGYSYYTTYSESDLHDEYEPFFSTPHGEYGTAVRKIVPLPHDIFCSDPGWTHIPTKEYVSQQTDIYITLITKEVQNIIGDYNNFFVGGSYSHAISVIDWDITLGISLSASPSPLSFGVSFSAIPTNRYDNITSIFTIIER